MAHPSLDPVPEQDRSHRPSQRSSPVAIRLPRIRRPADHPLLTVQETARRLGCSEMTIRRRIAARQFPAVKIGRKAMVPRSFVERLLAAAEAGRTVVVDDEVAAWTAEVPARQPEVDS